MAEHSHRTFNTKWSITDDGIRYEGKLIPFSEIRRVVIHESDDSVGYFTSFDVNDYVLYYNSLRRYDKIEAKADAETIERKVNECLEKNQDRVHEFDLHEASIRAKKNKQANRKINAFLCFWIIIAIIFALCIISPIVIGVVTSSGTSNSGSSSRFVCQVCHRDFDGKPDDMHSITNTNMCVQCYKNIKSASGNN